MSTFDDYLTHDDKPYAENINDALLLSNVFDLTVPIELPTMFREGKFNSSTSPRKAGVSIFTLVSYGDLTITNSSISNSESDAQTLVFKYYPNFNSYGTISSLSWTTSGTGVTANIEGADGEDILTGHTGGTISGATTGLTELQEFTITLNIPAGVSISKINFVLENKDETRYGAEVGITDVNGLQDALDNKCNDNDVRLSNQRQPTFTDIPASSNLNNYKTPNFYYCDSFDDSKTISNHPRGSNGGAFYLLIEGWSNDYIKQRITYYDDSTTYIRVLNNGTWTNWRRIVMADEVFTNNYTPYDLTLNSKLDGTAKMVVRNGWAWIYINATVNSGSTLNNSESIAWSIKTGTTPLVNSFFTARTTDGMAPIVISSQSVQYSGASLSSGKALSMVLVYPIVTY